MIAIVQLPMSVRESKFVITYISLARAVLAGDVNAVGSLAQNAITQNLSVDEYNSLLKRLHTLILAASPTTIIMSHNGIVTNWPIDPSAPSPIDPDRE